MIKGWTGKRLRIDLSLRKAWSEEIPLEELRQRMGGRGLNASFFSQHFQFPVSPSSPKNPVAFAVGPLSGTLAPCSGWTSIASFSPVSESPVYGSTRMPGHFGASLKGAGFDQCILQGRSDRPIYLWIDGGEVKFEKADHLWGKETMETTVTVQEEKGDRSIEVLCIGPAGERQIPFANLIHRLSWTGDHLGLGFLFGVKQLKAIAIRAGKPVILQNPGQFLDLCLTLKDRIQKGKKMRRLKETGPLSLLGQEDGAGTGNFNGGVHSKAETLWAASLWDNLSGREGCFSCPVHCGLNIQHQEKYLNGIHLGKAWCLGPRIGVYNGEWTLKLHRLCQAQGLDPFLTGSLLARIMEDPEAAFLAKKDQHDMMGTEDQGERAFSILRQIVSGTEKEFNFSVSPVSENEDLEILADIVSFCMVVVNRLNLVTVSNIIDLIHGATGYGLTVKDLQETVSSIRQMESHLQNKRLYWSDQSTLLYPGKGQISQILRKEERRDVPISHGTPS